MTLIRDVFAAILLFLISSCTRDIKYNNSNVYVQKNKNIAPDVVIYYNDIYYSSYYKDYFNRENKYLNMDTINRKLIETNYKSYSYGMSKSLFDSLYIVNDLYSDVDKVFKYNIKSIYDTFFVQILFPSSEKSCYKLYLDSIEKEMFYGTLSNVMKSGIGIRSDKLNEPKIMTFYLNLFQKDTSQTYLANISIKTYDLDVLSQVLQFILNKSRLKEEIIYNQDLSYLREYYNSALLKYQFD